MKKMFRLVSTSARQNALLAVGHAPDGYIVTIKEPTRSLEANSALWAKLNDVSSQVDWHGRKLDAESWKHIFSSSLAKLDVVPNLDGTGFVALGLSTSKMSKKMMSDLLELITAFGTQKGVVWGDDVI